MKTRPGSGLDDEVVPAQQLVSQAPAAGQLLRREPGDQHLGQVLRAAGRPAAREAARPARRRGRPGPGPTRWPRPGRPGTPGPPAAARSRTGPRRPGRAGPGSGGHAPAGHRPPQGRADPAAVSSARPGRCISTVRSVPTSLSTPWASITIPPARRRAPRAADPPGEYHQFTRRLTRCQQVHSLRRGPGRRRGQNGPHGLAGVVAADAPVLRSRSTMSSPRPPRAEQAGWRWRGCVGPPPSLTATSTDPGSTSQATCSFSPGSGRACRMELLSSSLTTRAASPTAGLDNAGRRQLVGQLPPGYADAGWRAWKEHHARLPHPPWYRPNATTLMWNKALRR